MSSTARLGTLKIDSLGEAKDELTKRRPDDNDRD